MKKFENGYDYNRELTDIKNKTAERTEEYVKEHTNLRRKKQNNI